jgi:hypothetical protein
MGLANTTAGKSLIYRGLGYNLKVRGSNPLPATNSIKSMGYHHDSILFYFIDFYFIK